MLLCLHCCIQQRRYIYSLDLVRNQNLYPVHLLVVLVLRLLLLTILLQPLRFQSLVKLSYCCCHSYYISHSLSSTNDRTDWRSRTECNCTCITTASITTTSIILILTESKTRTLCTCLYWYYNYCC